MVTCLARSTQAAGSTPDFAAQGNGKPLLTFLFARKSDKKQKEKTPINGTQTQMTYILHHWYLLGSILSADFFQYFRWHG